MAGLKELMRFFLFSLKRKESKSHYVEFQAYQAELIIKELRSRGVHIKNKRILELGCGRGGYSLKFARETKKLVATDLTKPSYALKANPKIKFVKLDASRHFPFKGESFDLVICFSLIEHVKNPRPMLNEIFRVLKDKGTLILTFPPFWSPLGGHRYKPFHLLGEKLAIKIHNTFLRGYKKVKSYETTYGSWGLYPLKIKDVSSLLLASNFKIQDKWVRFSPLNFAKIPIFNEFLTWHVCFLCKKRK
ncbi:class I SAM-dependent methyltransferase [Candidatus Woesearchaeota archaeon]|nr:class I SAM-dependent methyltransferase [Candidatus Woesearchaeota archaeon]